MATSTVKLEKCEVCDRNKAIYTCPKCEVRTCCLTCVNIHKKELECNGIRDKTKFVPIKSFTDLDVLSDYRLLEEVGRSVDQLKRDPGKKCSRNINLPLHLIKLRIAASKKNVNLQFMPQNFSRHKSNTTYFKWKTNELYWRIEWIFPQAENTKWVTQRALDTTRLSTLIEDIIDPVNSVENNSDIDELNLRISLGQRLQFYQAAGLSGIKILLKAEGVVASDSKFYELDVTLTIQENLKNKTLIEFPTFYVILNDHSDIYNIIDSDDECTNEIGYDGRNESLVRKRKRVDKPLNGKQEKSTTVNYFFNSDFSESDDEKSSDGARDSKPMSNLTIPDYNELVKMEH